MAVQASDNRFDWCDRLLEAKQNYSAEECCNMIKNELSKLGGADPSYVAAVKARATREFPIRMLFIPVYECTITATYTWDTTEEEKHTTKVSNGYFDNNPSYIKTTTDVVTTHTERINFAKSYCTGVYSDLNPATYVGRNDQRFYSLDHVADLEGAIYNDACVYTEAAMNGAIEKSAKDEHRGKPYVNNWACTACMIPIWEITVTYNGSRHRWYFNAHNGCFHSEGYLVSQRIAEAAEETAKRVAIPHMVTYLATAAAIFVSFSNMNWEYWFATLLSLLSSLIVGISTVVYAIGQNKTSLLSDFGQHGDLSEEAFRGSIICMSIALGAFVWAAFCAIVW